VSFLRGGHDAMGGCFFRFRLKERLVVMLKMKVSAAAMILLFFPTISLSNNFTPVPKNQIVQSQSCVNSCAIAFNLCVRLRGNSPVGRSCEAEQSFCLMSCQLNPRGG